MRNAIEVEMPGGFFEELESDDQYTRAPTEYEPSHDGSPHEWHDTSSEEAEHTGRQPNLGIGDVAHGTVADAMSEAGAEDTSEPCCAVIEEVAGDGGFAHGTATNPDEQSFGFTGDAEATEDDLRQWMEEWVNDGIESSCAAVTNDGVAKKNTNKKATEWIGPGLLHQVLRAWGA